MGPGESGGNLEAITNQRDEVAAHLRLRHQPSFILRPCRSMDVGDTGIGGNCQGDTARHPAQPMPDYAAGKAPRAQRGLPGQADR